MGRLFLIDLKGSFYSCKYCRTPLALKEDLLSKFFYSMNGRAYLFYDVVNVTNGQREHRQMVTGWHTVVDIYCVRCGSLLGWEYVTAYEKSQKYKEGNFVLERCKVLDPDGHPYVPNQVVHNGQEPEIGQESEDDEEPEIGQEG